MRFRQASQQRPRPAGELHRLELIFRRRTGNWLVVAFVGRLAFWRDASSCPARFVDRHAPGDGECPRDHVCAPQEACAGEMQLKHRLLQQIRGCCRVACAAPHVRQQAWRESGVEFCKRAVVTVCIAIHRRVCRSPRLVFRDGRRPTSVGSAGLQWMDPVPGASQVSRLGGRGPRLHGDGDPRNCRRACPYGVRRRAPNRSARVARPRFVEGVGRGRCKGNGLEKRRVVLSYGTLTERRHVIGRCTGQSIWPGRGPRRPRSCKPSLRGMPRLRQTDKATAEAGVQSLPVLGKSLPGQRQFANVAGRSKHLPVLHRHSVRRPRFGRERPTIAVMAHPMVRHLQSIDATAWLPMVSHRPSPLAFDWHASIRKGLPHDCASVLKKPPVLSQYEFSHPQLDDSWLQADA